MSVFQVVVLLVAAFVLGSVADSFLNVSISRIPAGESVVSPRSRCQSCKTTIRWYHNIPVFSWVLLRGKCAYCGEKVSVRYALVEALTGLVYVFTLWHFGPHPVLPLIWIFCSALIVITFVDLDHKIIPDVISLPGILFGFACSFVVPWTNWIDSLLGIVVGYGSLWIVGIAYYMLTKKDGMGGGDLKLLAMLGAFLGWKAVFPVIFFSSLVGSIVGVPMAILGKKGRGMMLPFGPFLAGGGLFYFFWGPQIINMYFSFFSP